MHRKIKHINTPIKGRNNRFLGCLQSSRAAALLVHIAKVRVLPNTKPRYKPDLNSDPQTQAGISTHIATRKRQLTAEYTYNKRHRRGEGRCMVDDGTSGGSWRIGSTCILIESKAALPTISRRRDLNTLKIHKQSAMHN